MLTNNVFIFYHARQLGTVTHFESERFNWWHWLERWTHWKGNILSKNCFIGWTNSLYLNILTESSNYRELTNVYNYL